MLACSPALNWREVRLNGLVAMLPCKPDHAERKVPLGTQDVTMAMAGCEAAGALYAISHVQVADVARANAALADWQESMLAHFQKQTVQHEPYQLRHASAAVPAAASSRGAIAAPTGLEILNVQGKGPDGAPLQARLLWLAQGVDIYYVAVYAPKLQFDQFDMLFSELALQ